MRSRLFITWTYVIIILTVISGSFYPVFASSGTYYPSEDIPGDTCYTREDHIFLDDTIVIPIKVEHTGTISGILFRSLNIPENSIINNATLELYIALETPSSPGSDDLITIYGSGDFGLNGTFRNYNDLTYSYSSNYVNVNVSAITSLGYYSINVTDIIQEYVTNIDYSQGENIGLVIVSQASDPRRYFYSNEYGSAYLPRLNVTWGESETGPGGELVEPYREYFIWKSGGHGIVFLGGDTDYVCRINNTVVQSINELPFNLNFRSAHVGSYFNGTLYYFAVNSTVLTMWGSDDWGETWTVLDTETVGGTQNIVMTLIDPERLIINVFYTKTYDLYHHRFSLANETFFGNERYTNMDGRDSITWKQLEGEVNMLNGDLYPVMISGSTANSEIRWRNSHYNYTTKTWSAENEENANDERGGSILLINYNSSEYRIGFQGNLDGVYVDTRVNSVTPQGWVFSQFYSLGASFNGAYTDSLKDPDSDAVYSVLLANTNSEFGFLTNSPPYDETTFTKNQGEGNYTISDSINPPSMFAMNDDPYVVWCDVTNEKVYTAPVTWFSGSKTALQMEARRLIYSNSSYVDTTNMTSVSSVKNSTLVTYTVRDDNDTIIELPCVDQAIIDNYGNETAIILAIRDCIDQGLYNETYFPDEPGEEGFLEALTRDKFIFYQLLAGLVCIIFPVLWFVYTGDLSVIGPALMIMALGVGLLINILYL